MLSRIFLSAVILLTSVPSFLWAQGQSVNLQKYWTYRQRLRDKFIVISQNVEEYGVNIPASSIDHDNGIVSWSDGNNIMSHYLSMLATELWLLKNNDQDYSQTLKELYYAMLAMERLDLYSESSWRLRANGTATVDSKQDFNGLHLRDDVTSAFFESYKSHFGVANFNSVYASNDMEEISQDNIFHNMEGLALVANLVGVESVAAVPVNFRGNLTPYLVDKGIKSGSNVNFSMWAKDFVRRYLEFMQRGSKTWSVDILGGTLASITDHWILKNTVTGENVREGSGKDFDTGTFYCSGVLKAGKAITGVDLRTQDAFILSNSESDDLFNSLFAVGPQNATITILKWPWPFSSVFDDIQIHLLYDDYKVRTLAINGNVLGSTTFNVLRTSRDNNTVFNYEHMPLIYSVLHDPQSQLMYPGNTAYNEDRVLIQNLLDAAPASGPKSNGDINWSSDSRLVWPERLGQKAASNIEYSGLDYMVLHNLYYIAMRREDYRRIVIQNTDANYGSGSFRYRTIEAHNTIPSSGNASYYACSSISFKSGFNALHGSSFVAGTTPRANNYQGMLYKAPGAGGRTASFPVLNETEKPNEVYNVTFHESKPVNLNEVVDLSEEVRGMTAVKFYPNPTYGDLFIELPEMNVSKVRLEIVDVSGKLMLKNEFSDRKFKVDLTMLPLGIYFVKLHMAEKMIVEKISIIR